MTKQSQAIMLGSVATTINNSYSSMPNIDCIYRHYRCKVGQYTYVSVYGMSTIPYTLNCN